MKKLFKTLMMLSIFMVFLSCGEKKESSQSGNDKVKVGYVINNLNDTFQTIVHENAKKYFEQFDNVEFITVDAQEDVIKQQDQVNNLIQQGIKALIVVPVDTNAMRAITKIVLEKKVPLVYVNRNPFSEGGTQIPDGIYFIGSEEYVAGQIEGEFIGEKLNGKGGVGILQGILGSENTLKRTEGVKDTLKEKFPEMKVLAVESGNWQRDQGLSLTENWLSAYGKELNAIASNNDEMALGAIQALKAAGREDVVVIGIDAVPDAITSVKKGEMAATVLQDSVGQGKGSAELIMTLIEGKVPEEKMKLIPFKLITPKNIKDFE